MRQPHIVMVFHSNKMLLTLDLDTLIRVLLEAFGSRLAVQFRPMTDAEREAAEDRTGVVTAVHTRFLLKELRPDGLEVRREDLEERVVREGRK